MRDGRRLSLLVLGWDCSGGWAPLGSPPSGSSGGGWGSSGCSPTPRCTGDAAHATIQVILARGWGINVPVMGGGWVRVGQTTCEMALSSERKRDSEEGGEKTHQRRFSYAASTKALYFSKGSPSRGRSSDSGGHLPSQVLRARSLEPLGGLKESTSAPEKLLWLTSCEWAHARGKSYEGWGERRVGARKCWAKKHGWAHMCARAHIGAVVSPHLNAVAEGLVRRLAHGAHKGAERHADVFKPKYLVLLVTVCAAHILGQLGQLAQHILRGGHARQALVGEESFSEVHTRSEESPSKWDRGQDAKCKKDTRQ